MSKPHASFRVRTQALCSGAQLQRGLASGYSRVYVKLITIDGISKALGEAPLFEGVGFAIESAERIGFVGRNGRGKSTLLRMLEGSLEPDSGVIARKRQLG